MMTLRKIALKENSVIRAEKRKGELPYLEDMGFDSIITDESHFFKNSLSRGEKLVILSVFLAQIRLTLPLICP